MAYVAKRLLTMIPVLIFLSIMVFSLIHLIPGDPAEMVLGQDATPQALAALRAQMGLNHSVPVQYLDWMARLFHGNLGTSLLDHEPVSHLIGQRLPVTIELAVGTVIVAVLIAFPLGILAAVKRGRWADAVSVFVSTFGLAVPPFWIGLLFLIFFTVKMHLFPSSGYAPMFQDFRQNISVMVLPMVATGIREAAVLLRMLRPSLNDVLNEDYVRTARAKGLPSWRVVLKHALRNALVPVITTGGLQIAGLLGGLVITEEIFSLPGFGSLLVQSVFNRDYPTVQACALIAALLVIAVNLAVDIVYGIVDPRIRLERRGT
ncbi:MAG: ABC transporter permease [Alicyclobacillus herbarius]|uniref:ABC transporter permease n=1 Tax=Alicyclobacillus herbarius TaxID=122960 RepID=UPI00041263BE|nr:ABC transporter permease [Alicyclobacillus herbarius]MCL6632627.1 ABC transporter permease [Alicyclobacillus herbarius]